MLWPMGATPGTGLPLALLVVERMPFFAFQEENLRSLFSVVGYYADRLRTAALAAPVLSRFPDCPEEFAAEYMRLHRLQREAGPESTLAALVLPGDKLPPDWEAGPISPGRSADLFWLRPGPDGGFSLIALLPFCGETQARVFLSRLPEHAAAGKWVAPLAAGEPLPALEGFLRQWEKPDAMGRG
jgi:hypothetical protein